MPTAKNIRFVDVTLRDGEQAKGVNFDSSAKLSIAKSLAKAGIDGIEVGFPASSPGEAKSARKIADLVTGPSIIALCRACKDDIQTAYDAIGQNPKPVLHIFIAASDIHINAKFPNKGETLEERRRWVIAKTIDSIQFARSLSPHLTIQFTPEDSTRTDPAFLVEICEEAIRAGAEIINLADTVGCANDQMVVSMIQTVRAHVRNIDEAELSIHCHNDLGLATANTLQAILHGVDQVEVTSCGIGERAGNTSLEQIIASLNSHPEYYNVGFGFNPKMIGPISNEVADLGSFSIPVNAPIVGKNAFDHNSGIHQHGVLRDPNTYEFLNPDDYGIEPASHISLSKLSGRHGVIEKAKELNYSLTDEQIEEVYRKVISTDRSEIDDYEFSIMVEEIVGESSPMWKLVGFRVTEDENDGAVHSVRLTMNYEGKPKTTVATGNDALECIFNAIQIISQADIKLVKCECHTKSCEEKSLSQAQVICRNGKGEFSGNGTASSETKAAALAFISAVNKYRRSN